MANSTHGLTDMCIEIYYESDPIMGVNTSYDLNGKRHYDFFSSLYLFNVWASFEFSNSELIEVTNNNYHQLVEQGKI
ncbi:hypothetical protein PES01_38560 [Pseudoalteromonas espejiana]|uniref:Uncharacterized protein n=1 Tax=Pseudoalteromonas espejiana TaxID=28107 RepID=A0A510Y2B8_9GAMM|nr:hypothetical protein PES01_38560 [Pseudoalteromonas espejiana]